MVNLKMYNQIKMLKRQGYLKSEISQKLKITLKKLGKLVKENINKR